MPALPALQSELLLCSLGSTAPAKQGETKAFREPFDTTSPSHHREDVAAVAHQLHRQASMAEEVDDAAQRVV